MITIQVSFYNVDLAVESLRVAAKEGPALGWWAEAFGSVVFLECVNDQKEFWVEFLREAQGSRGDLLVKEVCDVCDGLGQICSDEDGDDREPVASEPCTACGDQ